MDTHTLDQVKPISGMQFAVLRVLLGLYLAVRFARLLPYGAELFSREGVLPEASLNFTYGILPNPLERWDSPLAVQAFLLGLVVLSILFTLGWRRRTCALLLWYGSACLFNRDNLISNPSLPYVGLLLLLCVCIPPGEPWRLGDRAGDRDWFFPAWAFRAAWVLMAAGYTYSGLDKLITAPSWRDGTALTHVLNLPLARPGPARDIMLGLPGGLRQCLTWAAVGAEVAFLPLALHPRSRRVAWLALAGMHLSVMALISFAELSLGMLLLHAFTFDPEWVARRGARCADPQGATPAPEAQPQSASAAAVAPSVRVDGDP